MQRAHYRRQQAQLGSCGLSETVSLFIFVSGHNHLGTQRRHLFIGDQLEVLVSNDARLHRQRGVAECDGVPDAVQLQSVR